MSFPVLYTGPMPRTPEQVSRDLKTHGDLRLEARAKAQEEGKILATLVREGFDCGLSKAQITRDSGFSRQAVDNILSEDP